MLRFLFFRVLQGIVVMWLVATVVFAMYFVAPHDVARLLAGRQATPQTVAAVSRTLGLNRPILSQYGHYLWNALHGNLGYSYVSSSPVTTLIRESFPATFSLALGGAVIWLIIGVSSGVLAANKARSATDRVTTGVALLFYSMPTFLLGELLLLLFFLEFRNLGLDWLPASGYVPFAQSPGQWALHLVLPWLTIALVSAATYTRLTRASMLDELGEDYIRTARAKGISRRRVSYRHALRSAITPVVTQFGIDIGTLLGGVIVTETIFGLPGLGHLAINAIGHQDLPTIIGLVLLGSAFVVVANLAVDVAYAALDPRVRTDDRDPA
jgi:peptide/nickel transport system permease protein